MILMAGSLNLALLFVLRRFEIMLLCTLRQKLRGSASSAVNYSEDSCWLPRCVFCSLHDYLVLCVALSVFNSYISWVANSLLTHCFLLLQYVFVLQCMWQRLCACVCFCWSLLIWLIMLVSLLALVCCFYKLGQEIVTKRSPMTQIVIPLQIMIRRIKPSCYAMSNKQNKCFKSLTGLRSWFVLRCKLTPLLFFPARNVIPERSTSEELVLSMILLWTWTPVFRWWEPSRILYLRIVKLLLKCLKLRDQ